MKLIYKKSDVNRKRIDEFSLIEYLFIASLLSTTIKESGISDGSTTELNNKETSYAT